MANPKDFNQSRSMRAPILIDRSEAEVIRALRRKGAISRTEISSIADWSKAKTSQVVCSMVGKGYLVEKGEGASQGGRRPRLLFLNNGLGFLVGLDIGASSVDIALADVSGNILQRRSEPADVHSLPENFFARCRQWILEIAGVYGCDPGQILGIGIGVPGPVDFSRGVLVAPPLMPEWENFPIREYLQQAFPMAYVVVDNDVNLMALGEQCTGDGKGVDHFLYVKIGTGIGCGIVSNGKLHRGSQGAAGDIGHICVDKSGPICRCGNTGCLEALAAGPAIAERAIQAALNGSSPLLREMLETNGGILRPEHVNSACREGDKAALDIIRASRLMIGDVLAGLVNFFNPSHIFIGGGITNFGNHLLVAIRRTLLRRSLPLATTHLSINYSRMGAEAGVTGAIELARQYLFAVENQPFVSV